MARRSGRLSAPGNGNLPKHKRMLSGNPAEETMVKRSRQQQTPPTKSQYFDDADEESAEETASSEGDVSAFGDDGQVSSAPEIEESEDEGEESEELSSSRKRGSFATKRASSTVTAAAESEIWRPGVKTGLGPGKQVIIKKPKARSAGSTPYSDETIHPNTLLFLNDLKANNNREWLKMHDGDFRASEKDWHSFVEKMTEKLTDIDDTIPELPVKDVVFRIYRDVRFSKDPTPYKPFFSVAWSRSGRKGIYAVYYLQISGSSESRSFFGGGLWHPEAAPTVAMRRDIDRHPRRLKDVLLNDSIRKEFLGGAKKTDAEVVKAFVKENSENALKTKPKGYEADHPDIHLLRLRNYTIGRSLSRDEVLGERGVARIAELLAALKPFITYLNSVVMPDDPTSDSEDESGDGEDVEEAEEEP